LAKVIIVGPEDIYEYFAAVWPEWETQHPVANLDQMWEELGNGALSEESSIVILNEIFDNPDNDELETAIVTFAPEALVLVVSYDADSQEHISQKVAAKRAALNFPEAPFYFLDTWDNPVEDVNRAIASYAQEQTKKHQAQSVNTNTPAATDTNRPQQPQVEPELVSPANQKLTTPTQQPDNFSGQRGLVIASTSSKGGSGKTTVALCTASMIYHSSKLAVERGETLPDGTPARELKVVIVDMDTRDGQIGFLLNQTSPSALNIYLNPDKSTDVIAQNLVYNERLGIHALLAPKRARTADFLTPDFYQDIIQKLRTMFDVVILDTSVNYLDALLGEVVLPIADAILFVTNLSIGSVYGMTRWMDEVTSAVADGGSGIPREKIGIVVNQSLPNVGIDQTLLQHAASGATLLVAIPLDTAAVVAASNHNSLSDIVLKHEAISPSYYQLAKKLWRTSPLSEPLALQAAVQGKRGMKPAQQATPVEAAAPAKKKRGLFR